MDTDMCPSQREESGHWKLLQHWFKSRELAVPGHRQQFRPKVTKADA